MIKLTRSWCQLHTSEVCFQLGGDLSKELATLEECPGKRGKNPPLDLSDGDS